MLDTRNTETNDFKDSIKHDTEAVALLERALLSLARFYKNNKIALGLAQQKKQEPEYYKDEDKAPATTWSGANYGGRKSETEGILAIISMLKEDLEKEMAVARKEEAEAQTSYETNRAAAQTVLDRQTASKVATEKDLADLEGTRTDVEGAKAQQLDDQSAQTDLSDAIFKDCSWVDTHFESRRTKRKAEIDGLVDAKNYLAGMESGDVGLLDG